MSVIANLKEFKRFYHRTGSFYLDFNSPLNETGYLKVYDSNGKVLKDATVPSGSTLFNLQLHHLTSGLYHVIFQYGETRQTESLLITR